MDIYLVNSGRCDFYDPNPPAPQHPLSQQSRCTFTDVTVKAGVAGGGYGMGAAVGDYDGDGFPDLYLTQYGSSILYHNNGDGTFTDVSKRLASRPQVGPQAPSGSDYDNDGRLDLFVCRFVDFSKEKNKFCGNPATGERYYCVPRVYDPMPRLAISQ